MAIATDLQRALSPIAFAEDVSGFPSLDPWQEEVLSSDADRIILNCSRQSGKSSVAALLGLHTAVYGPGSLILLLSPSLRQSSELFQRLYSFYRYIAEDAPPQRESALRLELRNGSRIISLPATEGTIRGYSGVALLIIDEAARVPNNLHDAVRPMLAVSAGRLVLLSTPYGKRGFFFETWERAEDWLKIKVTADACPRISAAFLRQEKRSMPSWFFSQEFLCDFRESEAAVFDFEDIEAAARSEVEQWKM